jgi:hypothetical protein
MKTARIIPLNNIHCNFYITPPTLLCWKEATPPPHPKEGNGTKKCYNCKSFNSGRGWHTLIPSTFSRNRYSVGLAVVVTQLRILKSEWKGEKEIEWHLEVSSRMIRLGSQEKWVISAYNRFILQLETERSRVFSAFLHVHSWIIIYYAWELSDEISDDTQDCVILNVTHTHTLPYSNDKWILVPYSCRGIQYGHCTMLDMASNRRRAMTSRRNHYSWWTLSAANCISVSTLENHSSWFFTQTQALQLSLRWSSVDLRFTLCMCN